MHEFSSFLRWLCLVALLALAAGCPSALDFPQPIRWIEGGDLDDYGSRVLQTSNEGFVVVGTSDLSRSEALGDIFVMGMGSHGELLWSTQIDNGGHDAGGTISTHPAGGFLILGIANPESGPRERILVAHVDSNGRELWRKLHIAPDLVQLGVQSRPEGGFLLHYEENRLRVNVIIRLELDVEGRAVWSQVRAPWVSQESRNRLVLVIKDGSILCCQTVLQNDNSTTILFTKADLDGHAVWTSVVGEERQAHYVREVIEDRSGNIVAVGFAATPSEYRLPVEGISDLSPEPFVWKLDASGDPIWQMQYQRDSRTHRTAESVHDTSDGGYVLTGSQFGEYIRTEQTYLLRVDANGEVLWDKTFSALGPSMPRQVIQTGDGRFLVVGWVGLEWRGNRDVAIIRTDSNGNILF